MWTYAHLTFRNIKVNYFRNCSILKNWKIYHFSFNYDNTFTYLTYTLKLSSENQIKNIKLSIKIYFT